MLLLPPVRFSTVTGWPHSFWSWSAIIRADRSTPPPAGEALMILIAGWGSSAPASERWLAQRARSLPEQTELRDGACRSRKVSPAEIAASLTSVPIPVEERG